MCVCVLTVSQALRLLPGTVFGDAMPAKPPEANAPQKTVLVYFVGGVTFAEIESLRYVSLFTRCVVCLTVHADS